jgi:hypothetical protein
MRHRDNSASPKNRQKKKSFLLGWTRNLLWGTMLGGWEKTCTPKNNAGLGVKNLKLQNVCLLLKFSYRTLQIVDTPWRHWITHQSPMALHHGKKRSSLAKLVFKNLPTLRAITQCDVKSGQNTFFWSH